MTDNSMMSGSFINHYGLFLPTLLGQGSAEQQSWWVPRAITFRMIGVYAQTELGHGSNVRGLNTVAHYDKNTQEFILHSPSLQAIKWWISGLGKVATHALVYAQLILDDKEYGIQIFMVQLRDENHRPLPGMMPDQEQQRLLLLQDLCLVVVVVVVVVVIN
jgi:acyl-CoA oxidase